MAPPRSAHVQLGDFPRTLDPAEAEGEFRQYYGVCDDGDDEVTGEGFA